MPEQSAPSESTKDGQSTTSESTSGAGDEQQQISMSSAQLAERLARAKPADYDELKAKAAKFDEIEQASKTELQRLTEDRDGHKTRGDTAELRAARLEVALEKGLTLTQAKRLVGNTREELEADADELLADLGKKQPPKPNSAQGRDDGTTASGDWLRDQLARR